MIRNLLFSFAAIALTASTGLAESRIFYVGTYTGGESKGIYGFSLDVKTGKLESLGLLAATENPSFLALDRDGKYLYAVNEVDEGTVSAFEIIDEGKGLRPLNKQTTKGSGPCHLTVDASGENVLFANYGSGSVGVIRIEDDGSLGEVSAFVQHEGSSVNPGRQKEPHAHCITLDPANMTAVAADLGADKIFAYRFDAAKGELVPATQPFAKMAPGSGPRHFAFHPSGRFGYVINEMLSTVTAFGYDPVTGELSEIGTVSTLPPDFGGGNSTAEIFVHPAGKFVYGSNRGHDSIAVFAIDAETGALTPVQHSPSGGKTPRNFALDPTGEFLLTANQDSGDLFVYRINPLNGKLSATARDAKVDKPVCIVFAPMKE